MSVKTAEKTNIKVLLGPQDRKKYLDSIYVLDGFPTILENHKGAYCPISLTLTPDAIKPYILSRQTKLKEVLEKAGIQVYDPATSNWQLNPDSNSNVGREQVYKIDSMQIASNRFFVGHHLIASSGFGNECEKARIYNRISVILHDRNIRISRMEPFRTIYLAYDNFDHEADEFVKIFEMLREYEPGMGSSGDKPALLGFHRETGEIVDLEEKVHSEFPQFAHEHDMATPRAEFSVTNPEIFYEHHN